MIDSSLSVLSNQEAVFIGNGEEYIWKPPEDDDIIFQPKHIGPLSPHMGENMAAGVRECFCIQSLLHYKMVFKASRLSCHF